jgi:hypothetical protein
MNDILMARFNHYQSERNRVARKWGLNEDRWEELKFSTSRYSSGLYGFFDGRTTHYLPLVKWVGIMKREVRLKEEDGIRECEKSLRTLVYLKQLDLTTKVSE